VVIEKSLLMHKKVKEGVKKRAIVREIKRRKIIEITAQ
jgi:hypothetical protein